LKFDTPTALVKPCSSAAAAAAHMKSICMGVGPLGSYQQSCQLCTCSDLRSLYTTSSASTTNQRLDTLEAMWCCPINLLPQPLAIQ
jgi:hypothetical protein